jgi:glycerophosphoryl diester phosphodiesterase
MTISNRPIIIAHRAGNEVSSLAAAEAAGADLVEADIWRCRGRLEVRHLKTMGPVPLLWDRWKLVPAWAPRLDFATLLRAAAPSTRFLFDLKGSDPLLPRALIKTLASVSPGREYWVCARMWGLLEPFRREPGVQVVHSVGTREELRTFLALFSWHENQAVSIHRKLLNPAILRALKERAPVVITWPVNTRDVFDAIRSLGVDGFTSDSLPLIQEFTAERPAATGEAAPHL